MTMRRPKNVAPSPCPRKPLSKISREVVSSYTESYPASYQYRHQCTPGSIRPKYSDRRYQRDHDAGSCDDVTIAEADYTFDLEAIDVPACRRASQPSEPSESIGLEFVVDPWNKGQCHEKKTADCGCG